MIGANDHRELGRDRYNQAGEGQCFTGLEPMEPRLLLAVDTSGYVAIESFDVSILNGNVIQSQTTLAGGTSYRVVASGTAYIAAHQNRRTDADYQERGVNGNVGEPPFEWQDGDGELRISPTGTPNLGDWGAFDQDHQYAIDVTGAGQPLRVKFYDSKYSDNAGSLTVTIFQLVPDFVNSTDDDADLDPNDGTAWTGQLNDEGLPEVTLRSLIQHSNATGGLQIVGFDIPDEEDGGKTPDGWIISPGGALPAVTDTTEIDGTTQPGYAGTPRVQVSGQGLVLNVSESAVAGLSITDADGAGIRINGNANLIESNYIGIAMNGSGVGSGNVSGVWVESGNSNIVTDNRISGNSLAGVLVDGAATVSLIENNVIGQTINDRNAIGIIVRDGAAGNTLRANHIRFNQDKGILVDNASGNSVGGDLAGDRNIVANSPIGVHLDNNSTEIILVNNLIQDSASDGVLIENGAATRQGEFRLNDLIDNEDGVVVDTDKTFDIGGPNPPADGNTIQGGRRGIAIEAAGQLEGVSIVIQGNEVSGASVVGVALRSIETSNRVLDNSIIANAVGVGIENGSKNNMIGSGNPADVNDILNNDIGIVISDDGTDLNTIVGNTISSNNEHGVVIQANADLNDVLSNEIDDNGSDGIVIQANSRENRIRSNVVTRNLRGVNVVNSNNNKIGAGDGFAGNTIEVNLIDGVRITSGSMQNMVNANTITNNGSPGLEETRDGVEVSGGSTGNTVSGNTITGNFGHGVNIDNADGNTVNGGNLIASNDNHGVRLLGASNNTISDNDITSNLLSGVDGRNEAGSNTIRGNQITDNTQRGIELSSSSSNNQIIDNFINANIDDGVRIDSNSNSNTLRGNAISDNGGDGVRIDNADGNQIGIIDPVGFSNAIDGGIYGVRITGTSASGNLVVDNRIDGGFDGVFIGGGAHGNTLRINTITGNLGGVHLVDAYDNAIGVADGGNVVTGGFGHGVHIEGAGAIGNRVQDNHITGNLGHGVLISNDASNNLIGSDGDGADDLEEVNRIENNGGNGITVATGIGNRLSRNTYESNALLPIDLGDDGLTLNDADDPDAGANNLQNSPVLIAATLSGSDLSVTYLVDSAPANAAYPLAIEFYRVTSGTTEWIGTGVYFESEAQASATATFAPLFSIDIGDQIQAIAIDAEGNTSEMSLSTVIL